ncbi:MAG TPA: tetratricopeptide repeat protein [Candidatus Hydrogenedentes bacterium]|nr:tetratricopeptide repeat protein [Candidatus Hydrogenedentota bacterium]HOS01933.1 tetratricopeptide repeat protein [Candidatus Hydrogenedentota bacterium]
MRLVAAWAMAVCWGLAALAQSPVAPQATAGAETDTPEQSQFDFANGLFVRALYPEAAEEYQNYLKRYPEGPHALAALYRLAEAEYAAKRDEAALAAFQRFLAKKPERQLEERATLRKGELLYRLKRLDEAAPILEAMIAPDVSAEVRAGAFYHLGKLRYDQGDYPAAQTAFKRVVDELGASPQAPFAHYQLGFVYLAQRQGQDAAVAFMAVASAPGVPDALRTEARFRAAEAYDAIGWHEQAVSAYEAIGKEDPHSPYAERAAHGVAWGLFHARKYPEAARAATEFLTAYAASPLAPGIQYLHANCLQEQKQYDEALAIYRAIREKTPASEYAARAQYKAAWTLHLQGKPEEAKAEIIRFLDANKDSPLAGDASFLLGLLLAGAGENEPAYQQFHAVVEKYPQSEFAADALYKAGECLGQLGRSQEAAAVFETFARDYPDNPLATQAILRVGDAHFFAASFEQAVTKYKTILDAKPDPAIEQETLYRLGIAYHNMQRFAESVQTFQTLADKYPAAPHVAEAHLRRGDFLLREGKDPVKAIEAYQASLAAAPEGPYAGQALKGLALARYETKDVDGAADLFVKVITEHPDVPLHETSYAWVGQRLFDQQKWDLAIRVLEALLTTVKNYPDPGRIRFKIAECHENAGRNDEAIALFRAIIETVPQSASAIEARYRMAQLHEKQKKMDKAIALYEDAANVNTGDTAARARFRLGELAEADANFEAAARHYMRVAVLFLHEQLSPESLWRAGQCYERVNRADQAKKAYQELLTEYPQSGQAAQAQQRLAAMP